MAGRRRHVGDLQGEIQELFAELWQVPRFAGMHQGFRPQVDCYRTDDPPALHIVFELPGIEPSSIEVVAGGRALLLSATRERPDSAAGARYHQMEIDYGHFQRRIDLAEDVDAEQATASYERGMLRIELPLATPGGRGERVQIEVERR
ncbi:MAG: Hsp20/alpha crystallin family protein [Gaiellaceae bacterium]